jgi:hypothetical protein
MRWILRWRGCAGFSPLGSPNPAIRRVDHCDMLGAPVGSDRRGDAPSGKGATVRCLTTTYLRGPTRRGPMFQFGKRYRFEMLDHLDAACLRIFGADVLAVDGALLMLRHDDGKKEILNANSSCLFEPRRSTARKWEPAAGISGDAGAVRQRRLSGPRADGSTHSRMAASLS